MYKYSYIVSVGLEIKSGHVNADNIQNALTLVDVLLNKESNGKVFNVMGLNFVGLK